MDRKIKTIHQHKRHRRVRSKVKGTAQIPRLAVFRSLNHISVQIIDDEAQKTLASASTLKLKVKASVDTAMKIGKEIAKATLSLGITQVVFDRAGYKYHGKVKAVAEGAREAGLKF